MTTTKNGLRWGRPPLPPGAGKTYRLNLHLPPALWAEVVLRSDGLGISNGEYIRRAILAQVKREETGR